MTDSPPKLEAHPMGILARPPGGARRPAPPPSRAAGLRIRDLQEDDRPRERMLRHGAATLSDAELLALVVGTGTQGMSALDLARSMVKEYGDLRRLLARGDAELLQVPGLGEAKIAKMRACVELGRRYLSSPPKRGERLCAPSDFRDYLLQNFRDRASEVFCCLFLDTRQRVLSFEEMFHGSLDSAHVHPREVVRRALDLGAWGVAVMHNHPSGVAEPSMGDRRVTRRLAEALSLVDVRLLDHYIVGDGQVRSFVESGLM